MYNYDEELQKLIENQDNISFFCDVIKGNLRFEKEKSKEVIDKVIQFCKNNGLDEAKAWMYYYKGWYYLDSSDMPQAMLYFFETKNIFEKNDNKLGLVYAYNGLSAVYSVIGQNELSSELNIKGIHLAKSVDDKKILYTLLINAAINNCELKQYDDAKEIIEYIESNFDSSERKSTNLILEKKVSLEIEVHNENADMDEVIEHIKEIIILDENRGITVLSSELYRILGTAYAKNINYTESENSFKKSYQIARDGDYLYELCDALIEWSKLDDELVNYENEVQKLVETINIAQENSMYKMIKRAAAALYELYKKHNENESALKYLEMSLAAENKINNYSFSHITNFNLNTNRKEIKVYQFLYDKPEILSRLGEQIISNLDVNSILYTINNHINSLIETDYFCIITYNNETEEISHRTILNDKVVEKKNITLDDSYFSTYCIKNKKAFIMDNINRDYNKYINNIVFIPSEYNGPLSAIYIPLMVNQEIVGAMSVQNLKEAAYTASDISMLKLIGNYVAIALKNAYEYEKMQHIAIYDSLTGFLTKREIIKTGERIKEEFDNTKEAFCIMMIDIDNFKTVNDTYGHVVGDYLLKMVTQTIGKLVRTDDFIGRYGGDEFLLICPNTTKKNAQKMANRIRRVIENTKYIAESNVILGVTISIGVYEFVDSEKTFLDGVNCSDLALYRVKKANKNAVNVFA